MRSGNPLSITSASTLTLGLELPDISWEQPDTLFWNQPQGNDPTEGFGVFVLRESNVSPS